MKYLFFKIPFRTFFVSVCLDIILNNKKKFLKIRLQRNTLNNYPRESKKSIQKNKYITNFDEVLRNMQQVHLKVNQI